MSSLINTKIKPFKATAYHQGKFVPVTDQDLLGKWTVVCFYPADFTFVCPTELGDLADFYAKFQEIGVEVYSVSTDTQYQLTPTSRTKPGTMRQKRSRKSTTQCWLTQLALSPATSV